MTDLWSEATLDHEHLAREAAFDRVEAELQGVMPFLLAARSPAEYGHRRAMAEGRLEAIALRHGLPPAEVLAVADRRFALCMQALNEGTDPLDDVVQSTHYSGGGPERADQHSTGPDFGPGYSEVPRGNLEHVVDQVVQPGPGDPPQQWFQPVTMDEAPAHPPSLMPSGGGQEPQQATARKQAKLQRQADDSGGDYMSATPPDLGTGPGSADVGVSGPAGPPSVPAGNNMPAGTGATTPMTPPSIGQVTSTRDPVHAQILAVTASVRATNPWLAEDEARRIARQTVGRYFRTTAAPDYSMTSYNDSPPAESGGGGGSGGDGGGNVVDHMLEGQGLKSLLPGPGGVPGGAAGGAGEAGGAAEVAELAAL